MTSDGLAEDEIKVSRCISTHPTFIKVLGRVTGHPAGLPALLMPLLPADTFQSLGGPPSFDSITRDTYPQSSSYALDYVLRVLSDVASGMAHLSALGIMHGDLYAHNILTDVQGHALLTDFGAASFYSCACQDREMLERIEVRAFGCLMEDLIERVDDATAVDQRSKTALQALRLLMDRCFKDNVLDRPSFVDLRDTIQLLIHNF